MARTAFTFPELSAKSRSMDFATDRQYFFQPIRVCCALPDPLFVPVGDEVLLTLHIRSEILH